MSAGGGRQGGGSTTGEVGRSLLLAQRGHPLLRRLDPATLAERNLPSDAAGVLFP